MGSHDFGLPLTARYTAVSWQWVISPQRGQFAHGQWSICDKQSRLVRHFDGIDGQPCTLVGKRSWRVSAVAAGIAL
jgi:hypothetical protein